MVILIYIDQENICGLHLTQINKEIVLGRPPGPEMEYCTDRESYSLAAGLALGMVCLGVSCI